MSEKLIEAIAKFHVDKFNGVVNYNSENAKTITIENKLEIRLVQLASGAVLLKYRTSLQNTITSIKQIEKDPLSFRIAEADEIISTIRSYKLAAAIAEYNHWNYLDENDLNQSPVYHYTDTDNNPHIICLFKDGTVVIDQATNHILTLEQYMGENPH